VWEEFSEIRSSGRRRQVLFAGFTVPLYAYILNAENESSIIFFLVFFAELDAVPR
jgi:hypothetical protein